MTRILLPSFRWMHTMRVFCCCGALWSCAVYALAAELPGRWKAHDMSRPRPPVVTPAPQQLPVAPPEDAIVLFDGKDLSAWRNAEGGAAEWEIRDGSLVSVPDSGYINRIHF